MLMGLPRTASELLWTNEEGSLALGEPSSAAAGAPGGARLYFVPADLAPARALRPASCFEAGAMCIVGQLYGLTGCGVNLISDGAELTSRHPGPRHLHSAVSGRDAPPLAGRRSGRGDRPRRWIGARP